MRRTGLFGIKGKIHRTWLGGMVTSLLFTGVMIYGWRRPTLSPHRHPWSTHNPSPSPLPPSSPLSQPHSAGHGHVIRRGKEGEREKAKADQLGFESEKLPLRHISSASGDPSVTSVPPSDDHYHLHHHHPPLHTGGHSSGMGVGGRATRESTQGTGKTTGVTNMAENSVHTKRNRTGEVIESDMSEKEGRADHVIENDMGRYVDKAIEGDMDKHEDKVIGDISEKKGRVDKVIEGDTRKRVDKVKEGDGNIKVSGDKVIDGDMGERADKVIAGDTGTKQGSTSQGVNKQTRVDLGNWDTLLENWETDQVNRGGLGKGEGQKTGVDTDNTDDWFVKWGIDEGGAGVKQRSLHKSGAEKNAVDKNDKDTRLKSKETGGRNPWLHEDMKDTRVYVMDTKTGGSGTDKGNTGAGGDGARKGTGADTKDRGVTDRGTNQIKTNTSTDLGEGHPTGSQTPDDAGPLRRTSSVRDISDIDVRLLVPRTSAKEEGDGACSPHHHLVFVKVHKAASSTLANIVQRYGFTRQLNFVLPNKPPKSVGYNYITKPGHNFTSNSIRPPPPGGHYDLLWNHAIYNRSAFHKFMPHDTVYVTMLREPFQQFVSAYAFYNAPQISDLDPFSINPFSDYLHSYEHPKLLDYFRNKQSEDLGMRPEHVLNRTLRHQYLRQLNQDLHLVMITEMFDESLILLRRLMCWSIKDVLYISKNKNGIKPTYVFSKQDYTRHQQLAAADYDLYQFFKHKFLRTLAAQDVDFDHEVMHFKDVLRGVHLYCSQDDLRSQRQFFVPRSPWSSEFKVSQEDCELLVTSELAFLNKLLAASDAKVKQLSQQPDNVLYHPARSGFRDLKFS